MSDAPKFTRETLEVIVARKSAADDYYTQDTNALATFAISLLDRAEKAERELAEAEEAVREAAFIDATGRPGWTSSFGVCPVSEQLSTAVRRAVERGKKMERAAAPINIGDAAQLLSNVSVEIRNLLHAYERLTEIMVESVELRRVDASTLGETRRPGLLVDVKLVTRIA